MRLQFEIKKRDLYILALVVSIMCISVAFATYIANNPGHNYDQLDLGPIIISATGVGIDADVDTDSLTVEQDAYIESLEVEGTVTGMNMRDMGMLCGLYLESSDNVDSTSVMQMPCKGTALDFTCEDDECTVTCPQGYIGVGMDFDKGVYDRDRWMFTCLQIERAIS